MNPMVSLWIKQLERTNPRKANLVKRMAQSNTTPAQAIKGAIESGDLTKEEYERFKSAYQRGTVPIIKINPKDFEEIDKAIQKSAQTSQKQSFRF